MKLIKEPVEVFPESDELKAQRLAAQAGWFEDAGAVYDANKRKIAQSMAELAEGLWRSGVILEGQIVWGKIPYVKDAQNRHVIAESGDPMRDWPKLAQRIRSRLAKPLGP